MDPQFLLSHHLQRQILMKMLFLKPSDGLLEAEISSDKDCNQIENRKFTAEEILYYNHHPFIINHLKKNETAFDWFLGVFLVFWK